MIVVANLWTSVKTSPFNRRYYKMKKPLFSGFCFLKLIKKQMSMYNIFSLFHVAIIVSQFKLFDSFTIFQINKSD